MLCSGYNYDLVNGNHSQTWAVKYVNLFLVSSVTANSHTNMQS